VDFYGLAATSDRVCGPDTSPKRVQRPGGVRVQPGCQCADPSGLQRGDPQVQRPATAARKPPTDAAAGCAPDFSLSRHCAQYHVVMQGAVECLRSRAEVIR
jgi:hypothetical protein